MTAILRHKPTQMAGLSGRLPQAPVTLGNCLPRSSLTGIWCGSNGLIADQAYGAARDVIDEIEALQQEQDLALEEEFHFTYARMAFAAGLHEIAISSVNEYLLVAGRDADFYRDALELLDSAEEALRLAEVERRPG